MWFLWDSNPGPFVCNAGVITATQICVLVLLAIELQQPEVFLLENHFNNVVNFDSH